LICCRITTGSAGISAMNAINVDIVRSLFMPLFLAARYGRSARGQAILRWGEPGANGDARGRVLYVGMFVVTMSSMCR